MNQTQISYVIVRCEQCRETVEQIAVVDDLGEDVNLFERLVEVRSELKGRECQCQCGYRLHATFSPCVQNGGAL